MKRWNLYTLWYYFVVCFVVSLFFSTCSRKIITVEDLTSPTSSDSRYPNLLVTSENSLMMSWLEPLSDDSWSFKYSEWNGTNWAPARTIFSGNRFFVNWADFPSIYQLSGDTLAAHWLYMAGEGTYDYDIMVSISNDRGESWILPESPHRDGVLGEHGFLSFFKMERNKLGMAWLDGRNMIISSDNETQNFGQMSLYSTSWVNGEWGPEILLDERVCECCPTSALVVDDQVMIAYRDRSIDEVRNMQVVRFSEGNWTLPTVIHNDDWMIPGCPVNGPVLAGNNNILAAAWFTAPDGDAQVNISFSSDIGQSFQNPIRIDSGNPLGRVDLVKLPENDFLISWMEWQKEDAEVKVRTVKPDGTLGKTHLVGMIDAGRGSGIPQMIILDDWIYLSWTEIGVESGITLKRFKVNDL